MRLKLLAALQHVVLADRTIHDSGNLKSIIEDKNLPDVLEIADVWYKLPFSDKGREAIQNAVNMGRDAREHTIYRVIIKDTTFIYFIGTEDQIVRKLEKLKDTHPEEEEEPETQQEEQVDMTEQTSPKMSDTAL
jgi:hypothetical protein